MRLTYNYSTGVHAVYAPENEREVLFGTDTYPTPFIERGHAWATYDIGHWDDEDILHFESLGDGDKAGLLEGLSEIQDGIYGVIATRH